MTGPNVRKVTEETKTVADLTIPFRDERAKVLTVSPSKKEADTVEKGRRFLQNFHSERGTIGFEINYDGSGVTSFNLLSDNENEAAVRTQFTEEFNEAFVDTEPTPEVEVDVGEYLGIMEFEFSSDYWYPLLGIDSDDFNKDPFSSLISKMTDAGGSRVSQKIQLLATPVPTYVGNRRVTLGGFLSGLGNGEGESWWESLGSALSKALKRTLTFTPFDKRGDLMRAYDNKYNDNVDKQDIAEAHQEQFERIKTKADSPRYAVTIRYVAYGESEATVTDKMTSVSNRLSGLFTYDGRNQSIKQSLTPTAPSNKASFRQVLSDMAQRYSPVRQMGGGRVAFDSSEQTTLRNIRTKRNTPMLMSADVLACLFHLPSNDDVNDDTVSWESGTEFGFLPPEAEAVDMEDDDDWDTDW